MNSEARMNLEARAYAEVEVALQDAADAVVEAMREFQSANGYTDDEISAALDRADFGGGGLFGATRVGFATAWDDRERAEPEESAR